MYPQRKIFEIKSCLSGKHEVRLKRSSDGHFMVCVKDNISRINTVLCCKDEIDAEREYAAAVQTSVAAVQTSVKESNLTVEQEVEPNHRPESPLATTKYLEG
jgi:hypothetical protein